MITIDEFKKLEIRMATIVGVERVEGADKLLKLQLDLGEEQRQILAGIAEWYQSEDLVGKQIPVLVNLEPRTMKGEVSKGMMLAADGEGRPVLLQPEVKIPAGSVVR